MKAICKDNSRTFRNRLTIDKEYQVIEYYTDFSETKIVKIICDNGEKHAYRSDRFILID
jgi:hypothetical protein